MLRDKLHVDDKDVTLLSAVMRDPDISQQVLADQLKLSQPSINVRLHKLKDKGILARVAGIDAKRSGLALARVDFTCTDAEQLLSIFQHCSFFVNGFVMSGTRNVCVFLIGEDLRKVEHIVNRYLRANPRVHHVELSVVVNTAKEFVCAIDLKREHSEPCADPESCKDCTVLRELQSQRAPRFLEEQEDDEQDEKEDDVQHQ
ncbi:Lrp/AsnC family transcriptional regulator [Candidatus Woesearchaeota archaeon]|nr:Lrp/AsnC family transcriptional regulator [Candidatus Woesearchaeota archaeon]